MGGVNQLPLWAWAAFGGVVLVLLVVDLLGHRGSHGDSRKSALIWSIVWVGAGLLFNGFVWFMFGAQAAQEYLAAWAIEKSLSLDNLFVFLIIFQSLQVPQDDQHRVLFWGIFGALVFRGLFIFVGAEAIEQWQWLSYVFGAVLLYAAYRSFREDPSQQQESKTAKWLSEHLPVTEEIHGKQFVAEEAGRRVITPLLIALMAIEVSDVMFAVDSVPAAFSVTHNVFIIYSSNVFAILGLRALYVLLAQTIGELKYLHYGLAAVLAFAGLKIMLDEWLPIPPLLSVGIIAIMIGAAVWASLRERQQHASQNEEPAPAK